MKKNAQLEPQQFAAAAKPYVETAGISLDERWESIAASIQEKARLLTEVPAMIKFFYDDQYPFDPEAMERVNKNEKASELLDKLSKALATLEDWEEAKATIGATAKANGAKPGQLMFPTRVALSGMAGGPDLGAILTILGKEESVRRIKRAVSAL